MQAGGPRDQAQYYVGRIPYLRAVVKASKTDEDKLIYDKQVIDSLVAALRTGQYPQGRRCWRRSSARAASSARTRPTASSASTSP